MPILRNLKEFKEIAKAEEPELTRILTAIEQTLANMFIETANEDGIKRFEKILSITPEESDTLDTRRVRVISKWNNNGTYTISNLKEMLTSFCGEDNFEIIEKYDEYILEIITHLSIRNSFETVCSIVADVIPCNLILELSNAIDVVCSHKLYTGGVVTTNLVSIIPSNITTAKVNVPLCSAVTSSVGVSVTITTEE